MTIFNKIILTAGFSIFSLGAFAQESSSISDLPKGIAVDTIEVSGVCGMCEERIERAAFVKGVKKAEWDKKTQQLVLTYKEGKCDLDEVHNAIAAAGHNTDKVKATEDAYGKLPGCCQYNEGDVH